jgi:4-hydroxyphenylpyruvate dioxygenase
MAGEPAGVSLAPMTLCAGSVPIWPLAEVIPAAARSGFTGLTMWERTFRRATTREGLSISSIRRALEANSIAVTAIEGAADWADSASRTTPEFSKSATSFLLDLAYDIGAPVVTAITPPTWAGNDSPQVGAAELRVALTALCDRASARGVAIELEFTPFTPASKTLRDAAELVAALNISNLHVLLDTWHHGRAGRCGESDTEAARLISSVQLADGPAVGEADLLEETRWRRLPPGRGGLEISRMVRDLVAAGAAPTWSVEVYNPSVLGASVVEVTSELYQASSAVLQSVLTV